ncbi:MAG: DUF2911 domain-containing protein, partial [Gemmatimonadota bacterium]
ASGQELVNRASPPDSTSIRLGDGVAKICYSSPRARGREIMGELVPYGKPWRLGANEQTTLHLTVPATFGDVALEAGSYALYAVPGKKQWKIVVNDSTERWGVPIDGDVRSRDVGSVTVEPARTDGLVENLSLDFEESGDGASLVIAWERTRLEVPLRPGGS